MAIGQLISMGIGSPSSIPLFVTHGLSIGAAVIPEAPEGYSYGVQPVQGFLTYGVQEAAPLYIAGPNAQGLSYIYVADSAEADMAYTASPLMVAASDAPAGMRAQADYLCDGVDDHVQINAALADLGTNGGVIQLTEGTFTIAGASDMNLPSKTWIRGMGVGSTTLQLGTNSVNDCRIFASAEFISDSKLSDMTLDGNKANQGGATGQDGTRISGSRIVFDRVEGNNFTGNGLTVDSTFGASVWVNAIHCRADGNDVIGISWKGAVQSSIVSCIASSNGTLGINAGDSSRGVSIIGCTAKDNSSHGIAAVANGEHRVVGNFCFDNGGKGIRINADFCTVQGNVVRGSGTDGIYFSGSDNCTCTGNVSYNNNSTAGSAAGIGVDGSTKIKIVGNDCQDTRGTPVQDWGIDLKNASADCTIIGNDLRGNLTAPIRQNGAGGDEILGNTGSTLLNLPLPTSAPTAGEWWNSTGTVTIA